MTDPRRLLPATSIGPWYSFDLVLVAEGFQAAQERSFLDTCANLWPAFLANPPFQLLLSNPDRLRVWTRFEASVDQGASLGTTVGNTPFGARYDGTSKTLSLDSAKVDAFIKGTQLGPPGMRGLSQLAREVWTSQGLVVFLLPPIAGGMSLTADLDTSVLPAGQSPSSTDRWYVATTMDSGWERVVIEAVARCLGLDDEWSRTEPAFATPDERTVFSYMYSPNLFNGSPPTGPPPSYFRWDRELDAVARSKAITVVPFGQLSPTPDEPIQLFEGGGRYRSKLYRSSADCFMKRRIGHSTQSPRFDSIGFCTLCRRHLTRVIAQTQPRFGATHLGNQKVLFDQVETWSNSQRITTFPHKVSATASTGSPGPWWAFEADVGAQHGGMRIKDLKLNGQLAVSEAEEPVAELIEFRDIVVEFDGGDKVAFDFTKAFASTTNPPTLEIGQNGKRGSDGGFLRGLKLTLQDDLGGRCPVELVLNLVLKEGAANIEPTTGVYAAKFYPQIGLKGLPGGTKRVKRFRGCVRVVCNNRIKAAGQTHGSHIVPDETIASFFTDTNSIEAIKSSFPPAIIPDLGRRFEVIEGNPILPAFGFPLWTFTFDYHKPNVQSDTEIYGVYGPLADSKYRDDRSASLEWPVGSSKDFEVHKSEDQGEYDNIHIHGSMGDDVNHPGPAPKTMVHAPGCAEACLHLHWRWGVGAEIDLQTGMDPATFRGWNRSFWGAVRAHSQTGSPLVPPNQDVHVAVTHPSTTRTDPWGVVVQASNALDPKRKVIWYTVDVTDPQEDDLQVILEMGISFAYRYNLASWVTMANIEWLRWLTTPSPPTGPDTRTDEDILHLLYSLSRWFFSAAAPFTTTSEQIPTGTTTCDAGVILEKL